MYDDIDDDFELYDDDACDEESISYRDWEQGWNSEQYYEMSEIDRWNFDHPDYDYEQAKNDEILFEIPIIQYWREYSEEKCEADDPNTFPSFDEWEQQDKEDLENE